MAQAPLCPGARRAPKRAAVRTGEPSQSGEVAEELALKGFDFQVLHPPELVPVLRALSDRLGRAADAS